MFSRLAITAMVMAMLFGPAGCDDDSSSGNADAGADAAQPGLAHGLAVLLSDFTSMSLTLVNPETLTAVRARCVDSGTRAPTLTQAFSADTVLSTQMQPDGTILLIDRANATLTWVDGATCGIVRQINVSTGFAANPADAVVVNGKVFVTRFDGNAAPTAVTTDFDEGSDVLVMDLATGLPTARIDLVPHATKAVGTVLPRPARMLLAGGRIYVALNNVGPDFGADQIGPGRIVTIDPVSNAVLGVLDPPGLENCGSLAVSPGEAGMVTSCNGNFSKSDGTQVMTSGVAWFPLASGAPAAKVLAGTLFGRPVSFNYVALLDANIGFASVPGEFGMPPGDSLWTFNIQAGTATKFFDASAGLALGTVAVDSVRKRLFVANGDEVAPRVEVFDITTASAPQPLSPISTAGVTGLPPRELAWY